MARIKGGMNAKKKHNRTLKLAKGYRGARSKQYRVAKQSVMRALTSLANVDMNRKMLAELAVSDKEGFATLAALAKEKVA